MGCHAIGKLVSVGKPTSNGVMTSGNATSFLYQTGAQAIVSALPDLLGPVQVQLLDLLSLVLARRPHRDSLSQAQLHALSQALLLGAPLALVGVLNKTLNAVPDCKQQTSCSDVLCGWC